MVQGITLDKDPLKNSFKRLFKKLIFNLNILGKISTIGGENALAIMVSGLCMKMEDQLGLVVTRL